MFSSNNQINFRQKIVVLVGFQICLILLANTYCACELADQLEYENQVEEMIEHYEGIERVRVKLEAQDINRCCSARVEEELPTVDDNKRIKPAMVWFMEPMDIIRSNMDRKYKEGKYLLFVDSNNKVYAFDLSLQGYDTEGLQQNIRGFLDE